MVSRPGEVLRCPWHGWEFDIRTGRSWWNPAGTRVGRYPVSLASGAEVERPGWQPGPYVAETYPVSVERKYVVVDLTA